ncbi:MAG: hypothetical protein ABEK59_06445 [Halobacteria archaeon]
MGDKEEEEEEDDGSFNPGQDSSIYPNPKSEEDVPWVEDEDEE